MTPPVNRVRVGQLIGLIVLLALVAASLPARAVPVSLCDYTPPQSRFIDLQAVGDFQFETGAGRERPVYDGQLRMDGVYLSDTQTAGVSIEGNLQFDLGDQSLNEVRLAPSYRVFVPGNDVFAFLGMDVNEPLRPEGLAFQDSSVLFGLGYGRFREVTPLAQALQVQSQLLRLGKLLEPLPDVSINHLADLISRHDSAQPLTTLMSDIAATLRDSGWIVGDPLGAPSLLAIEGILMDNANSKFCGWETQLAFDLGIDPGLQGMPVLDFRYSLAFRYALAPAPRSQFVLNTRWAFTQDLFRTFFLNATASYTYELSDFISISSRYAFSRSSTRAVTPLDVQTLNLSFGFERSAWSLLLNLELARSTGASDWSRSLELNGGYEFF